jgi:hypothetical protein
MRLLWGRRLAVYRLFLFRCNGHHLCGPPAETSKHKMEMSVEGRIDWRTGQGCDNCVVCNQHTECPAWLLFECSGNKKATTEFFSPRCSE